MPNVESLEIREDELRAMSDLAPLLGRSPRALKRFVNVYRLIKAGLSPNELQEFMRQSKTSLTHFEKVLFLLAVDTGLPRIAHVVYDHLLEIGQPPLPGTPSQLPFARLVACLARLKSAEESIPRKPGADAPGRDWEMLAEWIEGRGDTSRFAASVQELDSWVPRVAQFSFQAGADVRSASV